MRIGSLFSGAGGLDLAVESVFGADVAWHCEIDPAASKVLEKRWPGVPNLGDVSAINWHNWKPVLEVDILCLGFPCQDVSAAGKRAGISGGTRSGLWSVAAHVIDVLSPTIVVIENVRGLLSAKAHRNLEPDSSDMGDRTERPILRAAGAVLGDLADLRYDAQWTTIAACDVGAPHRRERIFIVATPHNYSPPAPAITFPIITAESNYELLSTPQSRDYKGRPSDGFNQANLCRDVDKPDEWHKYKPAIQRWERLTRPAPPPTEPGRTGKPRLSPLFAEWVMGWPDGWVTDQSIGITRRQQLRIIGNGVVPQQAAAALTHLLTITNQHQEVTA